MPQYDAWKPTLHHVKGLLQRLGAVPLLLLALWIWTVRWGEHSTYRNHVQPCLWQDWETWKSVSDPHRVLLIADPQLVDPHTYPGRPWPLSSLTVLYTDLYMKRVYQQLLGQLEPDSVLFLGDLFDGGREWGSKTYKSAEARYHQYGQDFWLKEYNRFQNLFVRPWSTHGMATRKGQGGRRLITSLPGNHDLGFAAGINPEVRSRFEAHFGPTNRVDVIGNHTFVSLDTVSLSAMDQVDIRTGASGTGDSTAAASKNSEIWRPVHSFLEDASELREIRIKQEIRRLGARSSIPEVREKTSPYPGKHVSTVKTLDMMPSEKPSDPLQVTSSQFPTIVLSHVPLYRSEAANCGPSRERGTAIPIHAGYQYQNVLTPLISRDIVEKLDASQITQIYSGDDHDYCEIEHDEFTGRIREITVKSVSWAMGVRKPGVQLVSLWNPVNLAEAIIIPHNPQATVDADRTRHPTNTPRNTVQNHMCLLPDQLNIFIVYGKLLTFTFVVLVARALLWKPSSGPLSWDMESDEPLLPLNYNHGNGSVQRATTPSRHDSISSTLPITLVTSRKGLGAYGNVPQQSRSRSTSPSKTRFIADSDDWGMPTTEEDRGIYLQRGVFARDGFFFRLWIVRQSRTKIDVFTKSTVFVAAPVLMYYGWWLLADL